MMGDWCIGSDVEVSCYCTAAFRGSHFRAYITCCYLFQISCIFNVAFDLQIREHLFLLLCRRQPCVLLLFPCCPVFVVNLRHRHLLTFKRLSSLLRILFPGFKKSVDDLGISVDASFIARAFEMHG